MSVIVSSRLAFWVFKLNKLSTVNSYISHITPHVLEKQNIIKIINDRDIFDIFKFDFSKKYFVNGIEKTEATIPKIMCK